MIWLQYPQYSAQLASHHMNTTKATLAGHWERHQPGANQMSTPHQTSQNVMPVQNGMGVTVTPRCRKCPRDQRPDRMAAPVVIMAALFC
jgi:hypothetical protein